VRAPGQFPGFDPPVWAPAVYRAPAPNRGPSGWGKPWWPTEAAKKYPGVAPGPDMPSPHESYKAIQAAGSSLAKWGSAPVQQHASVAAALAGQFAPILDAMSRGAFSSQYSGAVRANMERQLQNLRIQQEQMLMASEEAVRIHQQEMLGYGRIFELHRTGELTDREATEAAKILATRQQHSGMDVAINEKGIAGAWDLLNWEDAQMRQMDAANTTLRKATAGQTDAEEAAAWGNTGTPGGGVAGAFPGQLPSVGADAGAKTAEADAGATPEDLGKDGYTPQEIEGISGMVNDEPPEAYHDLKKGAAEQRKLDQGANRVRAAITKVANQKADNTPEASADKLEKIREINPEVADKLQGFADYSLNPNDQSIKNRERWTSLAHQIFPNYNRAFYDTYHKQYENPSSQTGKQFTAANRATSQFTQLIGAINALPIAEDSTIPGSVMQEIKSKGFTGRPEYSALNETLRSFGTEVSAVEGGGRPAVTMVKELLREVPLHATKAQLRAAARQAMMGTEHIVDGLNQNFKQASGLDKDAPLFLPQAKELFSGAARMNPYTGEVPDDAPPELKVVGTTPEQRKHLPSWLTSGGKKFDWKPLDQKTHDDLFQWLKENPNDPYAAQLQLMLGAQH
jgi:hypothetical protein